MGVDCQNTRIYFKQDYYCAIDYQQAEIYYKEACAKDKSYCNYEATINNLKGDDYLAKKRLYAS